MEINQNVDEQPMAPINRNVDEQPKAPINRNVDEQPMASDKSSKDWPFSYFAFNDKRDSPGEVRNAILVVAALLASASFQAIISPPDSIIKGSHFDRLSFICSTTLAWSSSMTIIAMLTGSFPFKREITLSYCATGFTFGLTLRSLGNITGVVPYILFLVCCFLPLASRWVPPLIKCAR